MLRHPLEALSQQASSLFTPATLAHFRCRFWLPRAGMIVARDISKNIVARPTFCTLADLPQIRPVLAAMGFSDCGKRGLLIANTGNVTRALAAARSITLD